MEGQKLITPSSETSTSELLKNTNILLTHTTGNHKLAHQIASHGGTSTHSPLLRIIPKKISPLKYKACYEANVWIFLSQHSSSENIQYLKNCLDGQTVIAIGPGTAQKLENDGLHVDLIPTEGYHSKGIAKLEALRAGPEKKVLIFSEDSSPKYLRQTLQSYGHQVLHIPTYQHQPVDPEIFSERINKESFNFISVHSQKSLCHLLHCIKNSPIENITLATLLVTTKVMQTTAKQTFKSTVLSPDNTPESILHTLVNHHTGRPT